MEYESLTSLLSSIFLCEDDVDICFWKPSRFEAFSTKSFSRELDAKLAIISPCSLVWDGLHLLGSLRRFVSLHFLVHLE